MPSPRPWCRRSGRKDLNLGVENVMIPAMGWSHLCALFALARAISDLKSLECVVERSEVLLPGTPTRCRLCLRAKALVRWWCVHTADACPAQEPQCRVDALHLKIKGIQCTVTGSGEQCYPIANGNFEITSKAVPSITCGSWLSYLGDFTSDRVWPLRTSRKGPFMSNSRLLTPVPIKWSTYCH